MGQCKKDVTPLLTHWSYIFLALTHRYDIFSAVILSQYSVEDDLCTSILKSYVTENSFSFPMRIGKSGRGPIQYLIRCLIKASGPLFTKILSYGYRDYHYKPEPHDDIIKWKHFPRCWPFVMGRWPVNSPHKGQWLGALMFSLICTWTNGWANNLDADDLRCHHAHHDVTVMNHHTVLGVYWDSCTHETRSS